MKQVELIADIVDGDIRIIGFDQSRQILSTFNGDRVQIRISKHSPKRSDQQNRWYWGVCIPTIINTIYEQSGEKYTKDDIHDWHLSKVFNLQVETKEMLGVTIMTYKQVRMSKLSTVEFNDKKEIIQAYWAGRMVDIPDPISINDTSPREV
jgi:hypothetical protein